MERVIVILDSNILSLLATPIGEDWPEDQKLFTEVYQCTEWFYRLLARGAFLTSSDLCDYEVRRDLIRIKSKSVQELDKLRNVIEFQKVSFILLQKAADLWAELRATGQPNKVKENIDIDCILSAQWSLLKEKYPNRQVIIATKNIKDFQNVNHCPLWQDIHC